MKIVTINIKGSTWEARLLTPKKYEKLHGTDSSAITVGSKRQIDFNKKDLIPNYVRHEILHAFVAECNTESTNLDPLQVEELCCSIFGEYGIEMIGCADTVLAHFME